MLVSFLVHSMNVSCQGDEKAKADSLLRVVETTDDMELKKSALASLCIHYRYEGDWEKQNQIIQEMLRLQEEKLDSAYLADTYNELGISSSLRGENEESLKYFQKALEINSARGHMFGVSASYENLAQVYIDMGNYNTAVDCLLKSIEIKKEHNYSRIFNIYMKLASIQTILETDKVDHYIGLARQEIQAMDSVQPADQVVFYNELGAIFIDRKMFDSSIVCNRNVLRISKEINWRAGIAAGLGNLADVFHEMGAIDSSIIYRRYSLGLSQELSDCEGITEEYLKLAELYMETGRYDSVLVFANKSLQKAVECDYPLRQSEALKFIADYYSSRGDFKSAFSVLQQYYVIKDSISSADVKNNIAELETKYQTKVKEQQIELLTVENQLSSQRLRVSILTAAALLTLMLLIIYVFFSRRRQARLKEANLKQQLFLSHMNPHFIFNALGSIQNYLYKNKPELTAGYLARFSFLMRSILSNSSKKSISLAEEIEILKNYMELEKMRLNNSFEYEINYPDDLETELIHIPPMMIQPFVENAIKHGLKEGREDGRITVSFKDKNELLEVLITDNGVGIDEAMKSSQSGHKSMALSIFNRRMQIYRKYSRNLPFPTIKDLSSSGRKGTIVELCLPVLK
ncbi:MAG: tetratricopeptide repeat protein [Bacteroidales bacterium]|nr:tetratricopeptide repeat protein [Bacteroidales bacterium]